MQIAGQPVEKEWWFGRRAPIEIVVAQMRAAIDAGQGLSMIRLGDGEGAAMCAPRAGEAHLQQAYATWFGAQQLGQGEFDEIAEGLRRACLGADILGLPTRFQHGVTERYGRVFTAFDSWGLPRADQALTDSGLHFYLQFCGALPYLLRGRRHVGVVGCRDLGAAIETTFGVAHVSTWLVRGEHHHFGTIAEPHWPDGFRRVLETLSIEEPGQPFLVAAGALGKIYCERIKALGGVALDIGSVLDAWAGVDSRARFSRHRDLFEMGRLAGAGIGDMRAALDAACAQAEMRMISY